MIRRAVICDLQQGTTGTLCSGNGKLVLKLRPGLVFLGPVPPVTHRGLDVDSTVTPTTGWAGVAVRHRLSMHGMFGQGTSGAMGIQVLCSKRRVSRRLEDDPVQDTMPSTIHAETLEGGSFPYHSLLNGEINVRNFAVGSLELLLRSGCEPHHFHAHGDDVLRAAREIDDRSGNIQNLDLERTGERTILIDPIDPPTAVRGGEAQRVWVSGIDIDGHSGGPHGLGRERDVEADDVHSLRGQPQRQAVEQCDPILENGLGPLGGGVCSPHGAGEAWGRVARGPLAQGGGHGD
mmetsp:Transcript_14554/g.25879  ORF Transcript_14554/g.25879 Transcript_14554/m.25879 type:complete len:291 (-) Transcript_14554:8511-9383(-)